MMDYPKQRLSPCIVMEPTRSFMRTPSPFEFGGLDHAGYLLHEGGRIALALDRQFSYSSHACIPLIGLPPGSSPLLGGFVLCCGESSLLRLQPHPFPQFLHVKSDRPVKPIAWEPALRRSTIQLAPAQPDCPGGLPNLLQIRSLIILRQVLHAQPPFVVPS